MAVQLSSSTRKVGSVPPLGLLALTTLCVVLDLALKSWARTELPGEVRSWLPGVLDLTLTYNTGAAWSLFSGSALPLALVRGVAGLGLIVFFLWRTPPTAQAVSLSLIAGGALGNAIDGLSHGRVTDMLASPALSLVTRTLGQRDFPIFNLADVWVVGGVLLLLLNTWVQERRTRLAGHGTQRA
ncbi:signal peptidase II [Deinococcus budaensis]|uniref:signal peptidase II n=1 Tax=Deinococcus budaensis TaxID=1665626 RepID=UPI00160CEA2B